MIKRWFCIALLLPSLVYGSEKKFSIAVSKFSTLVFEDDIIDVELGSNQYHHKIKGRHLLLRAKEKEASPTSLLVRYGKKKQYLLAEIFPNEKAPLFYNVVDGDVPCIEKSEQLEGPEDKRNTPYVFPKNESQAYFDCGAKYQGVTVILTNVVHHKNAIHLLFFVENASSIDLNISEWTFEYITYLKEFFFKQKKSKFVLPISSPPNMQIPAQSQEYFSFSIPIYSSNGGLSIYLAETDGERRFQFEIPNDVILNASRLE